MEPWKQETMEPWSPENPGIPETLETWNSKTLEPCKPWIPRNPCSPETLETLEP